MQTSSDGGEADSEHMDVAVIPDARVAPSKYVTTTTVEAYLLNAWRKSSASPTTDGALAASPATAASPEGVASGFGAGSSLMLGHP